MSDGHSSDDEPRMHFSTDNDFEGGQWIDGEFFYSKKKGGAHQSREDQVYGVFQDASSGDSSGDSEGGLGQRRKQRRKNSGAAAHTSSRPPRPVAFVPSSAHAEAASSSTAAAAPAAPGAQEEVESATAQVKNIIKSTTEAAKSNESFRSMLQQEEQKEKEKAAAHQKRLSSVNTRDMGQWEKHTKGVGRKLLDKFGFKGRLGANEDGISAAVEVKVRPSTIGLGFGGFVEASALETNKKLEAELRKEEYVPPVKKDRRGEAAAEGADDFSAEKRAAAAAWKKGAGPAVGDRRGRGAKGSGKVVFRDAMDLMREEGAVEKKPLFVDMRGPTPKVIDDIRDVDMSVNDKVDENVKPKLGQELLYNVNLMVDGTAREFEFESRKLRQVDAKRRDLLGQEAELQKAIDRDEKKLGNLKKIHTILGRIEDKIESETSEIGPGDIFRALKALKAEFPLEYSLLGITELVPHICRRMVSSLFGADWIPLDDPFLIADTFAPWFLGCSDLERHREDAEEQSSLSVSSVTPSLMLIVEQLCLFRIRRCLSTEWAAKTDPESAVKLLSSLYGSQGIFVSHKEFENILHTAVMPRLKFEVEKWNPTSDTVPIHWWLHPWLPMLKSELSEMYPDIRRKLGRALAGWDPSDGSALLLISPWKVIFDDLSMDNLLQRAIVPKLVSAVRGLPLDPQNTTAEHTELFSAVLSWYKMVPSIHMISILEGEFFPRWLQILSAWLTSDAPDFSEITQWYLGWKSLLPEEMLSDDRIAVYFNHALELMQHTLSGAGGPVSVLPQGVVPGNSYFEVVERRKKDMAAVKRLQELRADYPTPRGDFSAGVGGSAGPASSVTFKDFVEEFAKRNGIEFLPRTGRLQEGKQVYQFGKSSCYLDQGVAFMLRKKPSGASSWDPVTLEDMLVVS